jgi:hypothetical protein
MLANLTPDVALAERLFADLHAATCDGIGITRESYGEALPLDQVSRRHTRRHRALLPPNTADRTNYGIRTLGVRPPWATYPPSNAEQWPRTIYLDP